MRLSPNDAILMNLLLVVLVMARHLNDCARPIRGDNGDGDAVSGSSCDICDAGVIGDIGGNNCASVLIILVEKIVLIQV